MTMLKNKLRILYKKNPHLNIPEYQTQGAAGADISAFLDVEQLANAFNISKVELPTRVLDIDNFQKVNTGSNANTEPYVEDTDALFYLIDKDAIQLYETLNESESFRNPQAKYTNIWFDRWGIIASCHFANAIKFYLA